jgi:hypothetical protein
MTRRARIWIGVTLLAIVAFNYAAIGIPLYRNVTSLENRTKEIMMGQLKSGKPFKNSDDCYVVDVLKKEIVNLDRKLVVLNCVGASVAAIVISWVAFGLIAGREDRRKQ